MFSLPRALSQGNSLIEVVQNRGIFMALKDKYDKLALKTGYYELDSTLKKYNMIRTSFHHIN